MGVEGEESFSDRDMTGYHMPIPSIGGLNIKNRLKNSFNLFRTNEIPEIPKDTDRHGRPVVNPRDYGRGPGGGGPPPDPRGGGRPGGPLPPPQDRPRGYPPQQPHPPPPSQQPRPRQPPPEYYDRGRPPRPGPRTPAEVRHRLFVALFDYDPPTMSPNPDACEEELPFREGQLIKVVFNIVLFNNLSSGQLSSINICTHLCTRCDTDIWRERSGRLLLGRSWW
jgi:hypothetical protein